MNSKLTEVPVGIVMIEDDEGHARLIEKNIRRAGVNNPIKPFASGTEAVNYLFGADGSGLVLVCHENRGLTDHIRDVARRLAKVGYVACAVDLLSPEGGTAANNPDAIPGILTSGDINRHVQAFMDAITFYEQAGEPFSERVGMIGFCFGGGITWRTVTQEDRLKAAAPYYGPPPPLDQVPNIKAAVLGFAPPGPDPTRVFDGP